MQKLRLLSQITTESFNQQTCLKYYVLPQVYPRKFCFGLSTVNVSVSLGNNTKYHQLSEIMMTHCIHTTPTFNVSHADIFDKQKNWTKQC